MRFFRAGVTSNEAPAAERAEPPVHFYQALHTLHSHFGGNMSARPRAEGGNFGPHVRTQAGTDVFAHLSFTGLTVNDY